MVTSDIRLTELAQAAGCAAKIGQADLRAALSRLLPGDDQRVLVAHESGDDGAVVRLSEQLALVETVDIFPPIVDDPYDYGRIAAANALSDIYAMGAVPLSALSFVGWPMETLGLEPLGRVLEGAAKVCREAGIGIHGGHSIVDKEPKFGLFVTGTVNPRAMVQNSGARCGDILVLTKRLGTGVLTTAAKKGRLEQQELAVAIESMAALNRAASESMCETGVSAATDVTGFGLLGHLGILLRASSETAGAPLGATLRYRAVPLFPGVERLLNDGLCPGGTQRNLEYAAPDVRFSSELNDAQRLLLADAQTSGGLLMAVREDRLATLLRGLEKQGVEIRAVIGRIAAATNAGQIRVEL